MTTEPLLVELVRYTDKNGRLGRNLYRPTTEEGWKMLESLTVGKRENGFGERKKALFESLGIKVVVVNKRRKGKC